MRNRTLSSHLLLAICCSAATMGQALPPNEIQDPALRQLQQTHLQDLRKLGEDATGHHFPYRFYFSRKLGVSEKQQQGEDQRSIRFDKFDGKTVLAVTGNYFASYSTTAMTANQRARQTYQDVLLPILKVAVPLLQKEPALEAYAFEVSYHVRMSVLDVPVESLENMVLTIPKSAAERLIGAKSVSDQQAAILEGKAYLNAEPFQLWLSDDLTKEEQEKAVEEAEKKARRDAAVPTTSSAAATSTANTVVLPAREVTDEEIKALQSTYHDTLEKLTREMEPQAHFVSYSPPAFVAFRRVPYLEFSVRTTLKPSATGSRYKQAALAFDEHISHLVRPVLTYFKEDFAGDGLAFSTSIVVGPSSESSVAVEFFFPIPILRSYQRFDCTGQQLIDASFVMINGERVKLDLQAAESN